MMLRIPNKVATKPSCASYAPLTAPELHISPAIVLSELDRASASSPNHTTASRAELLRPELRRDALYLDVHLFPLAENW